MTAARRIASLLAIAIVAVAPSEAHAHTGHGAAAGFVAGVEHPLLGLDHLCAMVAVGLWAGQRGGGAVWLVPLTFVGVMAMGGVFGMLGARLPFVESGVAASVLVLGVLVAEAIRLPLVASAWIVGLFALFHGHVHGTELPMTASGATYTAGFVLTTVIFHATGIALADFARGENAGMAVRGLGAAVAACGFYFCVASL